MKIYKNVDTTVYTGSPVNSTHDATPQQVFGDRRRKGQKLREPDVFQVKQYDVAIHGLLPELQVQQSYRRLAEQRHVKTIVVR